MEDQTLSASPAPSAPVAIVDDVRFDAHRVLTGDHPERPERLLAARDGLQAALGDVARLIVPARPASVPELSRVHSPVYLDQLESRLAHGSGHLDADTYFCPHTR